MELAQEEYTNTLLIVIHLNSQKDVTSTCTVRIQKLHKNNCKLFHCLFYVLTASFLEKSVITIVFTENKTLKTRFIDTKDKKNVIN